MPVSIPAVYETRLPLVLSGGIVAIILTAFTPLILIHGFLFPFVTTRNVFFRICIELALAAVLLTGVKKLRKIQDADPILKFFFAYVVAIGASAVFGLSPWHSLFGDFERMGGVWAWLHLFLFYLVLRVLMRPSDWIILFRFVLLGANIVVVWGAAEFLPAGIRNPAFQTSLDAGSMIGNPGLLGPYLLLSLSICALLLVAEPRRRWKVYAGLSALILLFGIAGSRNRSSELGLAAGLVLAGAVFWTLHPNRRRLIRKYLLAGALLSVTVVSGSVFLAHRAPAMADRFGGRWSGFLSSPIDHSRTIEWKIALEGFRDRPIFGYGPENHQIVSSHHFDPKIYEVLGEEVFDRTHNAWLELLATTGIVGTLAMVAIWLAAILTVRTGVRRGSISATEAAIFSGALCAYAVYLAFWFFDVNSAIVWVMLLAFLAHRVHGPLRVLANPPVAAQSSSRRSIPVWAGVILIALAAYLHGFIPLVAAHDLSIAAGAGDFADRLGAFQRVMNSAAPQTLHTFPLYYRFLRSSSPYATAFDASPLFRKQYDLALQRGMIEADRSISRNSEDDRSFVDAARFSMLAGSFYGDARYLFLARNELLRAIRISPRRPDARVFLSSVYQSLGDSSKANAQLDSAIRLAPEYGGSFFFAARSALARNDPDSAASLLAISMKRKFPGNAPVFVAVVAALEHREEHLRAARLAQLFLEFNYGPVAVWKRGGTSGSVSLSPLAEALADQLPILYLRGKQPRPAILAALAFAKARPAATTVASEFVTDVSAGSGSGWISKTYLVPLGTSAQSAVSTTSLLGAPQPRGRVRR